MFNLSDPKGKKRSLIDLGAKTWTGFGTHRVQSKGGAER